MHPAPWGPSRKLTLRLTQPWWGWSCSEVWSPKHRGRRARGRIFPFAGEFFMYFLGAKKWEESQPRFNLVSQGLACFFFMMDLVFTTEGGCHCARWIVAHFLENIKVIPLPSLCLLKHDDKSKFTNMTHLICLGPNLFCFRFASETKSYICLLTFRLCKMRHLLIEYGL